MRYCGGWIGDKGKEFGRGLRSISNLLVLCARCPEALVGLDSGSVFIIVVLCLSVPPLPSNLPCQYIKPSMPDLTGGGYDDTPRTTVM